MNFFQILDWTAELTGLVAIPIMTTILFRRNIQEKKQTQQWNWTRTLLALTIASYMVSLTTTFLQFYLKVIPQPVGFIEIFVMNGLGMGLSSAFGLAFIFYIKRNDVLLFSPIFFYIFSLLYYILTDIPYYFIGFMLTGFYTTTIVLLVLGIKLKDNNTLGLAIFFILYIIFTTMLILELGVYFFAPVEFIQWWFGIYLALGRFKIYKDVA